MAGVALKRLARRGFRALGYEVRRADSTKGGVQARRPVQQSDETARFVARRLIALEAECVLDVGAHVGEFGHALRSAGWKGRIVSFEPVRASYDALAVRAAEDPLWDVHQVALGRTAGSAEMMVTSGSHFSSFLAPSAMARDRWSQSVIVADRELVDVRRLDELFDDVVAPLTTPRTFLKMDTQGYDLEVFAGAHGCLQHVVGLVSEVSVRAVYEGVPHWLDALAIYEGSGFVMAALLPVTRDERWRLIEADCVMIRASDALG